MFFFLLFSKIMTATAGRTLRDVCTIVHLIAHVPDFGIINVHYSGGVAVISSSVTMEWKTLEQQWLTSKLWSNFVLKWTNIMNAKVRSIVCLLCFYAVVTQPIIVYFAYYVSGIEKDNIIITRVKPQGKASFILQSVFFLGYLYTGISKLLANGKER